MSNQHAITQLIKEISGQANVIVIPRIFIRMTGDIKAALFLSQCVYWSDKTNRADGYFYKTASEWEEEIGLTRRELDKVRKTTSKFIDTKLIKANGDPTTHYKADIAAITDWIVTFYAGSESPILGFSNDESVVPICTKAPKRYVQKRQNDMYKSAKTLTEITTDIKKNPAQWAVEGINPLEVITATGQNSQDPQDLQDQLAMLARLTRLAQQNPQDPPAPPEQSGTYLSFEPLAGDSPLPPSIERDYAQSIQPERAAKKKASARTVFVSPPLPPVLDVPEFQAVWDEWIAHRRQIRHPLTDLAAKKQLKMLGGYPVETAIAMIEQSITNGWTGVFELPFKRREQAPSTPPPASEVY